MSESEISEQAVPKDIKQEGDEIQVQVLNPDEMNPEDEDAERTSEAQSKAEENKSFVQLQVVYDNYTILGRDDEGSTSKNHYRLITADKTDSNKEQASEETVYVIDQSAVHDTLRNNEGTQYVVMEGGDRQESLVIMEYPDNSEQEREDDTAASLLAQVIHDETPVAPPRHHRSGLPPPHILLSSPNFRLFLYSCRQCSFKCNAIKELTEHKKQNHSWKTGNSWKSTGTRAAPGNLQCAKCPHKALTHTLMKKHMDSCHGDDSDESPDENGANGRDSDMTCSSCGFESKDKKLFKKHILRHRKLGK